MKKEYECAYGKVRNINEYAIKKCEKSKLDKGKTVLVGFLVATLAFVAAHTFKPGEPVVIEIPQNCIEYVVDVKVNSGDTGEEIIDKFYNDETEDIYGSYKNYENAVIEKSNLNKSFSHLNPGDIVKVPCIIDKNNPLYLEMIALQNQIAYIEQNEYWVLYTVKPGEDLLSIAGRASGSVNETNKLVSEIKSKNNLDYILRAGAEIYIVNPKLGDLKRALNDTIEKLNSSLQNSGKVYG